MSDNTCFRGSKGHETLTCKLQAVIMKPENYARLCQNKTAVETPRNLFLTIQSRGQADPFIGTEAVEIPCDK